MAIRVALEHTTSYRYNKAISVGPQVVRLRPCVHTRTPVHSYSMTVQPGDHFCNWQQDPNGNFLARLVFPEKTDHLIITVDLVVDMVVFNPFDYFLEEAFENWPFTYTSQQKQELKPFLARRRAGDRFAALVASIDRQVRPTNDFLVEINQHIQQLVGYTIRMKPGVQTPETTLKIGTGSCRDSAWLLVQLLRHLGLAARFVSGYLIQLTPDKEAIDGPNGAAEDFTDLHAWCEVYVPGAGWIGLDPTSGLFAGEGHIPVACSPDPVSAAPISGGHERCKVTFDHTMQVTRLADAGRAGRPYEDEDWAAIDRCGEQVDAILEEEDVRLTVGGEPTFVSSRNPDADEWNTHALGPEKNRVGDALLRRLVGHWAPGAALHHGQGKWYPGEELPRWAYNCFWRTDGDPLWQDQDLFVPVGSITGAGEQDAAHLLSTIAEELGVAADATFPAYEDPWFYSWRERQLPANVDPLKNNLDDPRERLRLAKIFERGLNQPVGHVLPLAFRDQSWVTGDWFLRQEQCYLMPGDSPLGFRLPLDSQPWWAEDDRDPFLPRDPSAPSAQLPPRQPKRIWPGGSVPPTPPEPQVSAADIVRTALSIEPRDGALRVFLPPLQEPGPFIDLLAAIERAAQRTGQQLMLEGYTPPHHPQLARMAITPDPGVLEVNVPPVDSWRAQVDQMETLYDECHQLHLTADKFDVDGRHTGTGGGCHVVVGGATTTDSPWLRRPDLLASLVRYWVNHPSLTYVFSGSFVGPTSQAPRLDEARQDAVAELDLALEQLRPTDSPVPPWLVDRVLRNILIDVTGNTHRAEICIDKLYSPDGPAGRLGLVELRSFEMPPHYQMAAAQNLLVRALVAGFWRQPRTEPVARWGTLLHDRWLLPRYLEQDMAEVCQDLQRQGIDVRPEWFTPHSDFRMPKLGAFDKDGVHVEMRQAVEPWHVLGEEATAGGQARYVDSSCERMQILVRGATDRRHSIICNGYRVPLQATGTAGEMVAGVRYRAWQPPSCLHPTLPIDSPLHIDLYDEWHGRAIAGGTYHVVHPGGRAHETRPINANEAEGRRCLRFETAGHQAGTYRPRHPLITPEAPTTLDLRRCEKG